MKQIIIVFSFLIVIQFLTGCEYEDKYHYIYSYRLNNQLKDSLQGHITFKDRYLYANPIFFEIAPNKTVEIYSEDGGDGPHVEPIGTGVWNWEALRFELSDTVIYVNVNSKELWDYETVKSNGIYTFTITEDML